MFTSACNIYPQKHENIQNNRIDRMTRGTCVWIENLFKIQIFCLSTGTIFGFPFIEKNSRTKETARIHADTIQNPTSRLSEGIGASVLMLALFEEFVARAVTVAHTELSIVSSVVGRFSPMAVASLPALMRLNLRARLRPKGRERYC